MIRPTREVMRGVRPEENRDTIGRKRRPFEGDTGWRFASSVVFFILTFFSVRSDKISERGGRGMISRFANFIFPILRFTSLTAPRLSSRECSTTVEAIVQCAGYCLLCVPCHFLKDAQHHTFGDFVSRAVQAVKIVFRARRLTNFLSS